MTLKHFIIEFDYTTLHYTTHSYTTLHYTTQDYTRLNYIFLLLKNCVLIWKFGGFMTKINKCWVNMIKKLNFYIVNAFFSWG